MREELAGARQNGRYYGYHYDYVHSMGNYKNLARAINYINEGKNDKELPGLPKVDQGYLIQKEGEEDKWK